MIDPQKAYTYFARNFAMRKTSQNWYAFENPFDLDANGKKKMAVHFGREWVKCWRTEWSGSIVDFVMEYENVRYMTAKDLINGMQSANIDLNFIAEIDKGRKEISNVKMPKGYTPILYGEGALGKRARKYLTSRGFDLELMDDMGIGYCNEVDEEDEDMNYFGYIIIPFKRKGKLEYYIGRDFIGNYLRYKNPKKSDIGTGKGEIIFNEDCLQYYKRNFVLEGWTDAVTIGKQAVATLGWNISAIQRGRLINSECDELVFIPDKGKYRDGVKQAMVYIDHKPVVKVVNLENLNVGGDDANSIGRKAVMEEYRNTTQLTKQLGMKILLGCA